MLSIIYQIPMGLIESDHLGNVKQMNAKGVQLLLPVFMQENQTGANILDLLKIIAPGIVESISAYTPSDGCIINQQHEVIELVQDAAKQRKHYFFTVNKLAHDSFMYIFDDITTLYEKEQALHQITLDKAIEQSKFEIASGVLHDIGNAVVGFGSYLLKIKRSAEQHDIDTLQNLKLFLGKQKIAIASAVGDAKASAMIDLLEGIIANQRASVSEVKHCLTEQMGIISHIQEILSIQRHYVTGQSTERAPVNLRIIINDSIAMLSASFEIKGISITSDIPVIVPLIKGDRTKLMQVILNLLKNAVESVGICNAANKSVHVSLIVKEQSIEIKITDTGMGFEEVSGESFFEKGVTTKSEGNGLGLANCKSIIESHHGTIRLYSKGVGSGATAIICFELSTLQASTLKTIT
jgi:signal transduction histidine kinase